MSWTAGQAAAGVKDYEVERSLDGVTWVPLGTVSDTSYTDTATDFSVKYFYRVREVDNSNANSGYATVDATTGKFASSGSKLVSDDKLVTVSIPKGAFDRDVSCSISSSEDGVPTVPTKSLLIGPYSILCIDDNGTSIASYKKPLQVVMNLKGASSGYSGFTAQLFDGSNGEAAKDAKYDPKTRTISFTLTSAKDFAAYGTKQKGGVAAVFQVFLYLLLLAAGVVVVFYLRRFWSQRSAAANGYGAVSMAGPELPAAPAMAPTAAVTSPTAENVFEQAVARPSCTHLNMAQRVQPQTAGCAECTAEGKHWKALRICLVCGHVGCSDDSEEQHARKHFDQTGHPIIYEYGNPAGDTIGWCYIDQTYI